MRVLHHPALADRQPFTGGPAEPVQQRGHAVEAVGACLDALQGIGA